MRVRRRLRPRVWFALSFGVGFPLWRPLNDLPYLGGCFSANVITTSLKISYCRRSQLCELVV